MNLSTPRHEGRGLLKVHPEPRFVPAFKGGLRAVERVKSLETQGQLAIQMGQASTGSVGRAGNDWPNLAIQRGITKEGRS
ncbi:MAG TPA: hypothetical protein VLZ10_02875 [Thermodesulfobacteriota bacterium]|nr:hypothetical protein [Thermodesulfobacteriota bacterium]